MRTAAIVRWGLSGPARLREDSHDRPLQRTHLPARRGRPAAPPAPLQPPRVGQHALALGFPRAPGYSLGNHLGWRCPCDICRSAAPVFCRPELCPHVARALVRAPGKSGERVGQDRHSLITSGACMEPNDSVTNNPLDWRTTGCSPLAVVGTPTEASTTDLREALFND